MAVTLINTPAYAYPVSPALYSRWLATESPNNFRLRRSDYSVVTAGDAGISPAATAIEVATEFTGNTGDSVSVVDASGNVLTGTVLDITDSPAYNIVIDIPFASFVDAPLYINNNTERDGYYFEGRLTVNGVVQGLTIVASPDSKGEADLDVSGVLRIMVALGKTADYTQLVASEPTKGGTFTFEYRQCWYGSNEAYTPEGNTWYYVEAVRSVEQGSNLHEYVATEEQDAPWLNSFEQPVYFLGLPFDLSFLLPPQPVTSPPTELTVTIRQYNASNLLLTTTVTQVALGTLEGKVNSLLIDPAGIAADAAYMTAEITTP